MEANTYTLDLRNRVLTPMEEEASDVYDDETIGHDTSTPFKNKYLGLEKNASPNGKQPMSLAESKFYLFLVKDELTIIDQEISDSDSACQDPLS